MGFAFTVLLLLPCTAFSDWSPLVNRLIGDGFDETEMRALFSRPELKFEPVSMSAKIQELVSRYPDKPAQPFSYNPRAIHWAYFKDKVISRARSYLRENSELLDKISKEYCVPKEVIVSILLVETRLGDFVGGRAAFNSLAGMALCTDLETIRPYLPRKLITAKNQDYARTVCRQKSDWAYDELKALILYTSSAGLDPLSLRGSVYGAIGICQFMPSNIFFYGVDADNDGRIDLFSKADALTSVANYLRGHGWQCAMDKPDKIRVIFDYNHSSAYANTVLVLSDLLMRDQSSKDRPPKDRSLKNRTAAKHKKNSPA